MNARSTRERRPHGAPKKADRHQIHEAAPGGNPSEAVELVYQLMKERGGVPRRGSAKEEQERADLRMAEAP